MVTRRKPMFGDDWEMWSHSPPGAGLCCSLLAQAAAAPPLVWQDGEAPACPELGVFQGKTPGR